MRQLELFDRVKPKAHGRKKPGQLSVDLNLVNLCATGFYFCASCQKVTEREENYAGVGCCALCGSPRIKWHEPVEKAPSQPINPFKEYAEKFRQHTQTKI